MLGLYLHIPFCQAICSYCNFNRGLLDPDLKRRYVAALEREIVESGTGQAADTIFFGGGTPSLLEPEEVARLIATCRSSYAIAPEAEITLETNPETATPERLDGFRRAGVNRISFGVQSFDDAELKRLGRIHSADRAKNAVRQARTAGFDNLSFDLMFWLPGQTLPSWMRTIDEAIRLEPDHLSLYLLELYPNAPLKESMAREAHHVDWHQSSDDDAADMYLAAFERLEAAGLQQYEISNAARPGFSSRHNVKYWQGGSWRGFGCGAHSTVEDARWKNVAATTEYVQHIGAGRPVGVDRHNLSQEERVEEALFTGLRLTSGIDVRNFRDRYGVDPWVRYGTSLAPYLPSRGDRDASDASETGETGETRLMWRDESRFGLTRRGMLVANEILTTFV
jgi:putative oxygen-independent coproporphyrinogen III oxidase